MDSLRFVGLDVHAETIAVGVCESTGETRSLGTIPNRLESIRKLFGKLGPVKQVRVCYEAGPTGYTLYWQLCALGIDCQVIAPSLIPTKAGDRVKTDRKDALKLAVCHRNGDLTAVWVPPKVIEAMRDLVRAREAAKRDQLRARHRLGKFLLRHGHRPPEGVKPWTLKHRDWIKAHVKFEHEPSQSALLDYVNEVDHVADRITGLEKSIDKAVEGLPAELREVVAALQALRGIAKMTAVTVVSEVGCFRRFPNPSQLMGYSGMVSSEHSTGGRIQRGSITKTGNAHLRRVIGEAAWAYQHRPWVGGHLLKRQQGLPEPIKAIAWKAQQRLHGRYKTLSAKDKTKNVVVTAVGRELLGFVWSIAVTVEDKYINRAA